MTRGRGFSMTLGLSYGLVIAVLAVPTAAALGGAFAAAERRDEVNAEYTRGLVSVERLHTSTERISAAARAYLISSDPRFLDQVEQGRADFDAQIAALRAQNRMPGARARLDRIDAAANAYDAAADHIHAERARGASERELRQSFVEGMLPRRAALDEALYDYASALGTALESAFRAAHDGFRRALVISAVAIGAAALASVGLARWFQGVLATSFERERAAITARDQILGVVAHDLRNPLAAISLKAASVRRASDLGAAARQAQSIEGIARRMGLLIRTLLDAANFQENRLSVTPEPVRAGELLEEVVDVFADQAAAKSVGLELALEDADLRVRGDRERIGEALGNLVGNAVKFTPSGGRVRVSAAELDEESVCFRVTDTGPGVAAEDVSRIFDRLWQAPHADKLGSGLGLHIAKAIAVAHGGRIWVDSEPGRGATFSFTIPRDRPAPAAELAAAGRAHPGPHASPRC